MAKTEATSALFVFTDEALRVLQPGDGAALDRVLSVLKPGVYVKCQECGGFTRGGDARITWDYVDGVYQQVAWKCDDCG